MAFSAKYVHGMGWALVVLGTISIIMGSAADATFATMQVLTFFHYASGPIWSGVFVVVTGILGIFSGKHPTNKCLIVAFMVLAIFTILSTAVCIGLAGVGIILDSSYCYTYNYDDDGSYTRTYCSTEAIALHAVNILLALAELVMGFVASIMSCCGLANLSQNTTVTPTVIYTAAPTACMPAGQGGYIIMQQGVPVTTVGGAGGWGQQQYAAAVPMQVYNPGQNPPPYMQQPAPAPAETKSQAPA